MVQAVIFDMDGVIFDSERAVFQEWLDLAQKYNIDDIEIPYMKCIGVNAQRTREIFYEHYGDKYDYDVFAKETSRGFHAKYDGGKLPIKTGAVSLLQYLKENNVKVALASSTRVGAVTEEIRDAGLSKYFDVIIGGDMVEKSKPAPDIFLKAAFELGIAPEEAYVIEDSFNGIRAAANAGMIPIMVPDLLAPDEEIRGKAAFIFEDLNKVREFFETVMQEATERFEDSPRVAT